MSKRCEITQKTRNNGYSISHSHRRIKKIQNINLQKKRVWSNTKKIWIKLRISTKSIKHLHKINI